MPSYQFSVVGLLWTVFPLESKTMWTYIYTLTLNFGRSQFSTETYGPWANPSLAVACSDSTQYQCCSRERLWVMVDLKRCYVNIRNELMNITRNYLNSLDISCRLKNVRLGVNGNLDYGALWVTLNFSWVWWCTLRQFVCVVYDFCFILFTHNSLTSGFPGQWDCDLSCPPIEYDY